MSVETISNELLAALSASLQSWKEQGYPEAVIPVYHDVDGDGVPDYLGLSSFGVAELVPATQVEQRDETAPDYDGPAWVRK